MTSSGSPFCTIKWFFIMSKSTHSLICYVNEHLSPPPPPPDHLIHMRRSYLTPPNLLIAGRHLKASYAYLCALYTYLLHGTPAESSRDTFHYIHSTRAIAKLSPQYQIPKINSDCNATHLWNADNKLQFI